MPLIYSTCSPQTGETTPRDHTNRQRTAKSQGDTLCSPKLSPKGQKFMDHMRLLQNGMERYRMNGRVYGVKCYRMIWNATECYGMMEYYRKWLASLATKIYFAIHRDSHPTCTATIAQPYILRRRLPVQNLAWQMSEFAGVFQSLLKFA